MRLRVKSTIQAAGVLVEQSAGHQISYIRLLKLLYLADRDMLAQTGLPITFDRVVAMDNGPVLSNTYNLIKGQHLAADQWNAYFEKIHYTIKMIESPGRDELSRKAISVLQSVQSNVADLDDWELIEKLHEDLPEWQRNKPDAGSSKPIELPHILEAIGFDEEDRAAIQSGVTSIVSDRGA